MSLLSRLTAVSTLSSRRLVHTSAAAWMGRKTLMHNLLHGFDEDDDAPNTQSATAAKQNQLSEMQVHSVKPEYFEEYTKLVNGYYSTLDLSKHKVRLLGSWSSLTGDMDQGVHVFDYSGYDGYQSAYTILSQCPEYNAFQRALRPMLRARTSNIMLAFKFWEYQMPEQEGGVYELRSYTLKPGSLLLWENEWRKGLECRRQLCEPIAAWFNQLGDLSQVHHMWAYPDLTTRKMTREAAWRIDGWAATVTNTIPLIRTMNSRILNPMECSPLK